MMPITLETCRHLNSYKYSSGSSCGSDPDLTSLTLETHLLVSQLFPLLLAWRLCSLVPPLATSSPFVLCCREAKLCCVVLCCQQDWMGVLLVLFMLKIMKMLNFLCQNVNFRGCCLNKRERKTFSALFSSLFHFPECKLCSDRMD